MGNVDCYERSPRWLWADSSDLGGARVGEIYLLAQGLRLSDRHKKLPHNSIEWPPNVSDMKGTLWSADVGMGFQGYLSQLDAYVVRI